MNQSPQEPKNYFIFTMGVKVFSLPRAGAKGGSEEEGSRLKAFLRLGI